MTRVRGFTQSVSLEQFLRETENAFIGTMREFMRQGSGLEGNGRVDMDGAGQCEIWSWAMLHLLGQAFPERWFAGLGLSVKSGREDVLHTLLITGDDVEPEADKYQWSELSAMPGLIAIDPTAAQFSPGLQGQVVCQRLDGLARVYPVSQNRQARILDGVGSGISRRFYHMGIDERALQNRLDGILTTRKRLNR